MNWLNLGTAFIEGIILVISPCILSILPIILSSSLEGGKLRPVGVVVGLISSFVLFSLFLGEIVRSLSIKPEILRLSATFLIILFGLVMLLSAWGNKFSQLTKSISSLGYQISDKANSLFPSNGLISGFIVGACLGLIWTPCVGPLLGLALTQAALQHSLLKNAALISCFSLGVALPMLIISFLGKKLLNQISFLKQNSVILRSAFGSVILITTLFSSIPSFVYVKQWIKFNFLGDKSAQVQMKDLNTRFRSGCNLEV